MVKGQVARQETHFLVHSFAVARNLTLSFFSNCGAHTVSPHPMTIKKRLSVQQQCPARMGHLGLGYSLSPV